MLVITRGYMLLNAVLGAEICRDHIIDLLVDYGLDIDATHHGLSMVVPYPHLEKVIICKSGSKSCCHVGMDQYLYIPFLGDEHPFTSYFDVHQGYTVLTHCHV